MTWHTTTVSCERLAVLLTSIRQTGGTVTRSCPCTGGVRVTWISS